MALRIKLTLQFDGTDFVGWQVQPNGRSVQAEMCSALESLLGKTAVTGAGRTDSGVHALMYCCHADIADGERFARIGAERLPAALNARLPRDIAVLSACEAGDGFHARYSVRSKTYVYNFLNSAQRSPFWDRWSWRPACRLDAGRMDAVAQAFVGRHDFAGFMAAGSAIAERGGSAVREMFGGSVTECGELVRFRIRGDGFLYNMVRIMAGTLVRCCGERYREWEPDRRRAELEAVIASRDRARAGPTLPARGLVLEKIEY